MKVCERCGVEISTKDGEGRCENCEESPNTKRLTATTVKRRKMEREQIMRDCGLVKVKGAMGGTYWE